MKNFFKFLILGSVILFTNCGSGEDASYQSPTTDPPIVPPVEEISNYILSANVTNKYNATTKIDNNTKTITIGLNKNAGNGTDIKIRFELHNGVNMYSPKEDESVYNLALGASVWLEHNKDYIKYNIIKEDIEKEDIDPLSLGWTITNDYGSLPEGIAVYKSPTQMYSKNTNAYIAIIDMTIKDREFKILGDESSATGKTPNQFYNETNATIIINGGYFWYSSNTGKLHHIGMLIQNGKMNSPHSSASTRKDDKGQDAIFYPTRAVFSLSKSMTFACNWGYTSNGVNYVYPQPSPIKALTSPMPIPSSKYPANGWELIATEAIGAGPVLLYNGKIYNTWEEEIWDEIGGTNAQYGNVPRSAIGVTENRKLIFFAGEGRNITPGVIGFSTQEVAEILQSLGCVDAINLDGGGSTCMLINGKETVKPSGSGIQRAIVTAISIK